jgi:hypothetical protein
MLPWCKAALKNVARYMLPIVDVYGVRPSLDNIYDRMSYNL